MSAFEAAVCVALLLLLLKTAVFDTEADPGYMGDEEDAGDEDEGKE